MAISPDEAAFVGFIAEAIAYGLNIVLFFMSLGILTWYRKERTIKWPLLFITCLLFTCCTVHFALEFDNKLTCLIREPGIIPLTEETHGLLAADILFSIFDFFAQLVLIYRCWLVWSRSFIAILFPLVISLTAIACSMAGLGLVALTDTTAVFAPKAIAPLGTSSFALSLCLNIIVTAMIIGRIWWVARGIETVRSTTREYVHTVTAMLIESGALFLAVQLCVVVTFALGNPAQAVVVPIALQVYGIAPTLIIVRVGLGFNTPSETLVNTTAKFTSRPTAISVRTEAMNTTDLELASFAITKSDM